VSAPFFVARLFDLLLTDGCLACGRSRATLAGPLGLCLPCYAALRRTPTPACRRCGLPLPAAPCDLPAICGACRSQNDGLDLLEARWLYRPPLDRVVHALKFGRLERLGRELGRALAEGLRIDPDAWDGVVPVPLHWQRRLVRGFDQGRAIGVAFARQRGLPVLLALRRRRATRPQSSLSRQARSGNVRQAFTARRGVEIAGLRLLLVDDVVTTGSTIRAAAEALRRAGARTVGAVAVGLAPPPGWPNRA